MLKLTLDLEQAKTWKEQKLWHQTDVYFEHLHDIDLTGHRCYFCDFPDGKFLELHHVDGDHTNYDLKNLRPICSMCHRMIHPGWAALSNEAFLSALNFSDTLTFAQKARLQKARNNIGIQDETPERLIDDIDLAVLNQLQRFFLILPTLPQAKLEEIKKSSLYKGYCEFRNFLCLAKSQIADEQFADKSVNTDLVFRKDFHLGYIFDALLEAEKEYQDALKSDYKSRNHVELFAKAQERGDTRLTLVFNKNVFRPYDKRCPYTFEERMDFYQTNELLNPFMVSYYLHNGVQKSFEDMYARAQANDAQIAQEISQALDLEAGENLPPNLLK